MIAETSFLFQIGQIGRVKHVNYPAQDPSIVLQQELIDSFDNEHMFSYPLAHYPQKKTCFYKTLKCIVDVMPARDSKKSKLLQCDGNVNRCSPVRHLQIRPAVREVNYTLNIFNMDVT